MRLSWLGLACFLALCACSSSSDSEKGSGGSSGSGGNGGGGGTLADDASPPGSQSCSTYCAAVDGICSASELACDLACLKNYTLYPKCMSELDAWNLCASQTSSIDFDCDSNGLAELKPSACTNETNALLACFNSK